MPADFSEMETRSLLSDILKGFATKEMKGNETENNGTFAKECHAKLTKILSSPPKEPSMSLVPFYREVKDVSGLFDIYRIVMDKQTVPIVASHLLEWCIQVFDHVSCNFKTIFFSFCI